MRLFHLTHRDAWEAARRDGTYRPASLDTEGFIHLSTERQWPLTAARFFRGQRGLVLLEVAADRLAAQVRFEAADGDLFPHLYGALPVAAVIRAVDLEPRPDGGFDERGPG